MTTAKPPHIRWMIRRDLPEVLNIERAAFPTGAWTEEDFLSMLRQRNVIGMVIEVNDSVVGYMIYALRRNTLDLVNIAVHPQRWRQGIGSCLIERLTKKLQDHRRKQIIIVVRETNLSAQLFFRDRGFKAMLVKRNHYEDTGEAGYAMQLSAKAEFEEVGSRVHTQTRR